MPGRHLKTAACVRQQMSPYVRTAPRTKSHDPGSNNSHATLFLCVMSLVEASSNAVAVALVVAADFPIRSKDLETAGSVGIHPALQFLKSKAKLRWKSLGFAPLSSSSAPGAKGCGEAHVGERKTAPSTPRAAISVRISVEGSTISA